MSETDDERLRAHIEAMAARYAGIADDWLAARGEQTDWKCGDPADFDTPTWVRFLRAELAYRDGDDALDWLEHIMRSASLLTSAMNGVATAEFEAFTSARQRGAKVRHERDPRQREKAFIRACWREWRKEPGRYSSKAAFAGDMLDKCEHLRSQKKIEDWCREWEQSEPC
jgi:hypothetical protein